MKKFGQIFIQVKCMDKIKWLSSRANAQSCTWTCAANQSLWKCKELRIYPVYVCVDSNNNEKGKQELMNISLRIHYRSTHTHTHTYVRL